MGKILLRALVTVLIVLGLGGLSQASTIVSGSIYNIDGDGDGVTDDLKISRILFDVTAGTHLFMDSLVWEYTGVDLNGDGELTGFDNYMLLLTEGGVLLGANDDSSQTFGDGSVHGYDSTLDYTFTTAGRYLLTVGQLPYGTQAALLGYQTDRTYFDYMSSTRYPNIPPLDHGDWMVTMTAYSGEISNITVDGAAPVPEPATSVLFILGMAGIGMLRLRNKKLQR